MSKIDTLAVYWGDRRSSPGRCAELLIEYLRSLAKEQPILEEWYEKGLTRSGAAGRGPVTKYSQDAVEALVAKGANRKDVGAEVLEHLGFRISLWNGRSEDQSVGLSIKCGLFAGKPALQNSVVMQLPPSSGAAAIDEAALRRLLILTADAWDAEWGAVFDSGGEAIQSRTNNEPFLDKMLWLRNGIRFAPQWVALRQEVLANATLVLGN